jgi:hypothetical protein
MHKHEVFGISVFFNIVCPSPQFEIQITQSTHKCTEYSVSLSKSYISLLKFYKGNPFQKFLKEVQKFSIKLAVL